MKNQFIAELIEKSSYKNIIIMPKSLYDVDFFEEKTKDKSFTIDLSTNLRIQNMIKKVNSFYIYILKNENVISLTQKFITEYFTKDKNYNKVFIDFFIKNKIISLKHKGNILENHSANSYYYIETQNLLKNLHITGDNKNIKKYTVNYNFNEIKKLYGKNYIKILNSMRYTKLTIKDIINNFIQNKDYNDDNFRNFLTILDVNIFRTIKSFQKSDRVYNSFCTLPSSLRDKLSIYGRHYHSIDLRSAMPTLSLLKVLKIAHENRLYLTTPKIKNEIDKYRELINNGEFYEYLRPSDDRLDSYDKNTFHNLTYHLNDNNWREIVKVELYRGVLFNWDTRLGITNIFQEKFPIISKIFENIKKQEKNGGKTVAAQFQDEEAAIFNNAIRDLKLKSNHIFSVYDSIYFDNEEDIEIIKEYINDKFKYTGINPQFNIKINN